MKKGLWSFILICLLVLEGCSVNAFASVGSDMIQVLYNDQAVLFDTQPTIVDGRTMVPVGAIFNAFEMKVTWDGATKKVTARKVGLEIVLWIGSEQALVNGRSITLDARPFIKDGRTMVPLRFIAESTGAAVAWNGEKHLVTITSESVSSNSGQALTLTYPIVDTGETKLYSDHAVLTAVGTGDPFYGQDGNYAGNQPTYTDNQDGTVTDLVTGLMWQQTMAPKMSYDEAVAYANASKLGGYDDWRLPSIKELFSLIQYTGKSGGEVADVLYVDTDYFDQPLGDTSKGEREIDAQVWSSTKYVGQTMIGNSTVFGVNFIDGRIKGYPLIKVGSTTANKGYFRLVRGNEVYGKNSFVDNGDGTVTDLATGLMWQQADDGVARNWEDALSYAESLKLAGYEDWRLPNIKELQSIVDYTKSMQTTGTPAIDDLFVLTAIKDPGGHVNYGYYWSGTTHQDGANIADSASYVAFGEAQGKMNNTLMDVHGAGAVRSDPKAGNSSQYPSYFGPQGDVRYVYNYVLAVRRVQ